MRAYTKPFSIRLDNSVRAAADVAAAAERRSLSNLIEVALADWLRQHGYWKESDKPSRQIIETTLRGKETALTGKRKIKVQTK